MNTILCVCVCVCVCACMHVHAHVCGYETNSCYFIEIR